MKGEALMGKFDAEVDEDNYEDEGRDDGSQAMRQLRAADRAKAKRIAELEAQVTSLSESTRERSVKDALASRDLNPKIAAFIPKDIEPTDEAVGKWLDEYGDVFGAGGKTTSTVDPDSVAALQGMDAVMQEASTPAGREQIEQRIADAKSPEELMQILGIPQ